MKLHKEASGILELIQKELLKDSPEEIVPINTPSNLSNKEKEIIEQKLMLSAYITLAIVELRFNIWDSSLKLIETMPNMEI